MEIIKDTNQIEKRFETKFPTKTALIQKHYYHVIIGVAVE